MNNETCRKNRNEPQQLALSDEARLAQSNFNFNYPLAIYLHGFSESATGEQQSSQQLKDGKWALWTLWTKAVGEANTSEGSPMSCFFSSP